jgi:hypothetical protein
MRNKCRIMVQQTLKGLYKGIKMTSFVIKGLLYCGTNPVNFIIPLFVRCVLSQVIRSFCITYILRVKKFKLKRTYMSVLFNVVPSVVLFYSLKLQHSYMHTSPAFDLNFLMLTDEDMLHDHIMDSPPSHKSDDDDVLFIGGASPHGGLFDLSYLRESSLVVVFLIFMTSNRFIRASMRVLKILMKKNKKSKLKLQKRLLKERVVAAATNTVKEVAEKKEAAPDHQMLSTADEDPLKGREGGSHVKVEEAKVEKEDITHNT